MTDQRGYKPLTPGEIEAAERLCQEATISGFPQYRIDENGTVWSLRNWRGHGRREVIPIEGKSGYLKVRLVRHDGKRIGKAIHRLVAEAFLISRQEGMQIRHLNGIKTDNRASNLAWGTAAENAHDRVLHGTDPAGERNAQSKLKDDDVRAIRHMVYSGINKVDVAKIVGIDPSQVRRITGGEAWSHVR
jgi:hypothetical protein